MTRRVALGLVLLWLGLFVLAPLGLILAIALASPADQVPPFVLDGTLENLAQAAVDPLYREAFGLSLWTAAVTTVLCLANGYPLALAIASADERWRAMLLLGLMLPFWTGFLMRINAWIGMLRDDGWINAALGFLGFAPMRLLYTDAALYVGMVYTYLPFMVLPIYARLVKLDPETREAASDLGATPFWVMARVTLPLSLPGEIGRAHV